jgi:membrane protease YdiL (CAAX protease family)
MKNIINWKLFGILLSVCTVTSLMVLPYAFSLLPPEIEVTPILFIAAVIQAAVTFSIATFFGLLLAKRVGFGLPIIEGLLNGEKKTEYLRSILGLSVGLGVLAGVLIILFSLPFGNLSVDFLNAEMTVSVWKSFLASFYGGIAEEVLLRLFLMSLLVWIIFKFKKTPEGKPTNGGIWLAIIISSVIFGLGHLPITSTMTAITPAIVARAIVLNGIGGVIFGWLYWKKGLEAAMISHFSADIVIHVAVPLTARVFM